MAYCGATTYRTLCEWIPCSGGNIPYNAVPGGTDSNGETMYIGRAAHDNDVVPGKVLPSHGCCYVPYGGSENSHHDYQILISPAQCEFEWVPSGGGNLPSGSVQGGSAESGEALYIGRTYHEGSLTIGKVHPSHGCLYIPYGGEEHSYPDYEILVCKTVNF